MNMKPVEIPACLLIKERKQQHNPKPNPGALWKVMTNKLNSIRYSSVFINGVEVILVCMRLTENCGVEPIISAIVVMTRFRLTEVPV